MGRFSSGVVHHVIFYADCGYVVSSFRDGADGRHFLVADFQTAHLDLARNVARCRASEFGGKWHYVPEY